MQADIIVGNKQMATVKGIHQLTVCDIVTDEAKRIQEAIEVIHMKRQKLMEFGSATAERLHALWLEYNVLIKQLYKFRALNWYIENITTTVGRSVLAARLSGTTTYTGIVNYGALGTSATAAAIGNTTLGTETYRKALVSGTFSSNIAYLENFYTTSEVNGTFEEYGFFIDGTGSANTGQLFNRFTQTIAKSATQSLNVRSTITIADA